jgi:hypothetical protein
MPINEPAPGRLSTITGWPRIATSLSAKMRTDKSMFPPGAIGVTM